MSRLLLSFIACLFYAGLALAEPLHGISMHGTPALPPGFAVNLTFEFTTDRKVNVTVEVPGLTSETVSGRYTLLPEDFIALAETTSGMDLHSLFQKYLFEPGKP